MKPKVYATYKMPDDVERFMKQHCDIRKWEGEELIPRDVLLKEIANVDGLYSSRNSGGIVDEELLQSAPHLKAISTVSVGYNHFDVEAMKKYNVIGTHTPDVLNETVADLTFGLILSTARRIVELDRYVKKGNWKSTAAYSETYGRDVHSSTIGIIGMGRIGEAVAKRAKFGFDMDVLYYNRNRKQEAEEKYGAEYCELESLLKRSDFVVLMTPLTPETVRIIGAKEFKLMKKTACFINVSRGQTVDEKAMIDALNNGEIYAAGLDVYETEPVEMDNPLLTMPNVVTVPHIGSATAKTEDAMAMKAAENIVAILTGKGKFDKAD
ncbi:2-hydroxyacid dehydrogenase [Sporosarcina siberiensis]|uniref:2-hydroxyacid dehydrogenase n=1 Tax=Sporosarcina siberiensis TaxID=1365606 RepID=A0ABW4SE61_9BACL